MYSVSYMYGYCLITRIIIDCTVNNSVVIAVYNNQLMIMQIKLFALLLLVIIFTDAVEVTNEGINFPKIPHLLAKVQQLEAKIMVRTNIRNTRETTDMQT